MPSIECKGRLWSSDNGWQKKLLPPAISSRILRLMTFQGESEQG